jgi:hypothetical protein
VEYRHGVQGVEGSNPFTPTKFIMNTWTYSYKICSNPMPI